MASIELPSFWLSFLGPKTIASLIAVLVFFLELVFRRDRLRHIPGPFLARWTPLWIGYQARMGRRYIAVDEAHKVD
jgi:benzoate 4-monooxygenase